jgi:hypothetical protein
MQAVSYCLLLACLLDKTILVNVNRNKYPVMRPTWALKPGLTDRLVVGHNVTLTLTHDMVENPDQRDHQSNITELKQFRRLIQMTDPISRQRGRPTPTKQ